MELHVLKTAACLKFAGNEVINGLEPGMFFVVRMTSPPRLAFPFGRKTKEFGYLGIMFAFSGLEFYR
jgi:hypothetical protein